MPPGRIPPTVPEGFPPPFPDDLRTDAPLGCIRLRGKTVFRIFAPRAFSVTLVLFDRFDSDRGEEFPMTPGPGGAWERTIGADLTGRWYGYRIDGPREPGGMFDPSILVADPYSRAVTTLNTWRLPARTLILDGAYDWGDDRSPAVGDHSGLVIYECHVRDMTAHPSSGARRPGTYAGFAEEDAAGGLGHLLSLGVNAVELMPVMKFGTMEIPFRDPSARTDSGKVNEWNPYARNHWGYMTSFFFAPETYYGTDGTAAPGAANGKDGRAVKELKDLVRALHRRGIAVILDAVYNHTSHYDFNPFKYIDKQYYYRCDGAGNFLEESGCGNDFATERPMARRVILDSVRYWLEEYHVDGFRFDLAGMIDEETCRQITATARAVRPDAVLIAEPWGGGRHHPPWFAAMGWWSWSDRFRDSIRGRDPYHGRGLVFGAGNGAPETAAALRGARETGGGGNGSGHRPLNYLESHDGYTLGDFIRIASGGTGGGDVPAGDARHLTPAQLALNKFAALVLMSSPGPVMLHQGQELARAKVIVPSGVPDPEAGKLDHNSYNKDNATNYLDFGLRESNRELLGYYRGLTGVRKRHPLLCSTTAARTAAIPEDGGGTVTVSIDAAAESSSGSGPGRSGTTRKRRASGRAPGTFNRYIVLLNPSPDRPATAKLPPGEWFVIADGSGVAAAGKERPAAGAMELPPSSGVIAGSNS